MRIRYWSSDVCSSDLGGRPSAGGCPAQLARNGLMAARYTVEQLRARVGQELGVSEWLQVEQHLIDGFGRATRDPDPLHMDPEWAARKTPYGGTIAFGFWTLSMLTCFSNEIPMRSEEHTSELQSIMRISYAVFCLKKKNTYNNNMSTAH